MLGEVYDWSGLKMAARVMGYLDTPQGDLDLTVEESDGKYCVLVLTWTSPTRQAEVTASVGFAPDYGGPVEEAGWMINVVKLGRKGASLGAIHVFTGSLRKPKDVQHAVETFNQECRAEARRLAKAAR